MGAEPVSFCLTIAFLFSLLGLEVLLVEAPSDESDESPEADVEPEDEEDEVGSSLIVELRSRIDLFGL